jgi:hypothetical protein
MGDRLRDTPRITKTAEGVLGISRRVALIWRVT